MNREQRLNEMGSDLRRSLRSRVLYLEGKTDVPIFFGLLGVLLPSGSDKLGYLHEDCLVRGLTDGGGAGSNEIKTRVQLAEQTPGYQGCFFGFLDGDGLPLQQLDAPTSSSTISYWPAYCIENLLTKAGWPAAWGSIPDWREKFLRYSPYVALNRIHRELQSVLQDLGISRFVHPDPQRPLKTTEEVEAALGRESQLIDDYQILPRFRAEVAAFAQATANLDEAHALLDGKWLVKGMATERHISEESCRATWVDSIRQSGGLAEVRDRWQRILNAGL